VETRVIDGIEGLRSLVGKEIGVSDWLAVDQAAIDRFATATGDEYFIHVDPQRARAEAGLDSTIAHGLLTLSLGPQFVYRIFEVRNVGSALNYGYEKVRFLGPVPVDSRLRMRIAVEEIEDTGRGHRVRFRQTFEVEGADKPVCVADWLLFYWTS
jgi:acyl dehydratase